MSNSMFKAINLLLVFLAVSSLNAQGVREHTRQNTTDPARLRYRLGDNTKSSGAAVSEEQASDVTLTLNAVSVRPIQTWVRTAGRIDKTRKIVNTLVHQPEAT